MREPKYIAIFDSGIGGFTTLLDAMALFPKESFLFYADTQNVPYGVKALNEVRKLTLNAVADIVTYGVKAVILACNTATSAAVAQLREIYQFPVLGMEPAIKPALEATRGRTNERVLLLSTLLTMQGPKLREHLRQVDPDGRVDCLPLSELVEFAESMTFSGGQVTDYLKARLRALELERYGAVVLGCTHFIWYKELLGELLPAHVKLFDGNAGTLNHLGNTLKRCGAKAKGVSPEREIRLHFTKEPDKAKLAALLSRIQEPVILNQL